MEPHITASEAQAALATVDSRRRRVVAEIDVPRWYWYGVALGWIALGFVTDLGHPWVTAAATFAYGAIHATAAQWALTGRHASRQLSVSRRVAGHEVPRFVISGLVVLSALTIAAAVAANADGAGHPVTTASVLVAVIVVLGGPRLLEVVRRRAEVRTSA